MHGRLRFTLACKIVREQFFFFRSEKHCIFSNVCSVARLARRVILHLLRYRAGLTRSDILLRH